MIEFDKLYSIAKFVKVVNLKAINEEAEFKIENKPKRNSVMPFDTILNTDLNNLTEGDEVKNILFLKTSIFSNLLKSPFFFYLKAILYLYLNKIYYFQIKVLFISKINLQYSNLSFLLEKIKLLIKSL